MKKKILGFGNAVLDMISESSDEYLLKNNLEKGSMSLVEQDISDKLTSEINLIKKSSGGSVANTLVGISLLGTPTLFCGKVKNDDLGNDFKEDMEKSGTKFCAINLKTDCQLQGVWYLLRQMEKELCKLSLELAPL